MQEISENLSDLYYEKLTTQNNPGVVLAQFYGQVFGVEVSRNDFIMFNRLLNLYGRFIVFFTILDMTSVKDLNLSDSPYQLLSYFAKRRLEQKYGVVVIEGQDLNKMASTLESKIEKQKKAKLKLPELE